LPVVAIVGIRELIKARLSRYLKLIAQGERVVVTDRGRPVAVISPIGVSDVDKRPAGMMRDGAIHWDGRRPRGAAHPARLRGPSIADAIIEDRR
jgi:prevent-host-death family protein